MAGSGDLSSIGWQHALNAAMVGSEQTGKVMGGPPGDFVGVVTTALTADTAYTSLTLSGNLNKYIPNNAVLLIAGVSGAVNTWDICTVNLTGGYAAGTGSGGITVQSFRPHRTTGTTDRLYLIGFAPFLALNTTAPTQIALGTEVDTPNTHGYTRQPLTYTATTGGVRSSLASNPAMANNATITFGPFTQAESSVTNGSIMDSDGTQFSGVQNSANGNDAANMYAYFTWGTAKTPGVNDSLQISAAALSLAGT
jgi:hypothetical protein